MVSEILNPVVSAEEEELVSGQDAFGGGGDQNALAGAFDAANLDSESFHQIELGQGFSQPSGIGGRNLQGFHRDLVKLVGGVRCSGSAQELFRPSQLFPVAEQQQLVSREQLFSGVRVRDQKSLAI